MGKHGCGEVNDNVERLVVFYWNSNCVIGATIFPHKNVHKLIWRSSDDTTENQIDHFIVNNKWRRSIQHVRTFRGADANSDHYLVVRQLSRWRSEEQYHKINTENS